MMNYVLNGLMDFSIAYNMQDTVNGKYQIRCPKLSFWVAFPFCISNYKLSQRLSGNNFYNFQPIRKHKNNIKSPKFLASSSLSF